MEYTFGEVYPNILNALESVKAADPTDKELVRKVIEENVEEYNIARKYTSRGIHPHDVETLQDEGEYMDPNDFDKPPENNIRRLRKEFQVTLDALIKIYDEQKALLRLDSLRLTKDKISEFVLYGPACDNMYNAFRMLQNETFSYTITPKSAGSAKRWRVTKHLMKFIAHELIKSLMCGWKFMATRFNRRLNRATIIFYAEGQRRGMYVWHVHVKNTGIDICKKIQSFSITVDWKHESFLD